MRLQSYDEFGTVASFGPMDGNFVAMSRDEASGLLEEPLSGHFSKQLGPLAVLYRGDRGLRLRIGDVEHGIEGLSAEWSRTESTARFALNTPTDTLVLKYCAAALHKFDFTVGAEDEHFDFGLFLANVMADEERASRLYPGLARG